MLELQAAHLKFDAVTCAFGSLRVVDDVHLEIQPGEHVALIGSNGSGKTTLLRAILGLHPLGSGRILLNASDAVTAADWKARRARIAWMPQRQATGQFPLLVHELLDSSSSPKSAYLHAQELGVGDLLHRPLHSLSGGQLQRVFLARALGSLDGGAGLLLADEPTAALDFDGQVKVAEVLRGLSATVLVVTHDRAMAERSQRVVEMAGGRLREVRA
jgi:ABC-type Mn2+/Zn2+ transport system ATPase subunit